jgi:hypothetical protein
LQFRDFFQIKGIYDRIFPFLPTKKREKKIGGFNFKGFNSFPFQFFELKNLVNFFCFQKIIKFRWLNLHQEKKIPIFLGLKEPKNLSKKQITDG